jgi:hypothetical protein
VFTARYALSPYIKQIRFVFKGLNPTAFLWESPLQWGSHSNSSCTSEARKVQSVFNKLVCQWLYWHPYYSSTVLVETTSLMKGIGLNFVFLSGTLTKSELHTGSRSHLSDIEQTKQEFSLRIEYLITLTRNSGSYKIYRIATKPHANISYFVPTYATAVSFLVAYA